MEIILDYEIVEMVGETDKSIIYRCKKENVTYIAKVLKARYPSLAEIARFKQEYDIIKTLDIQGVIKVFDMVEFDNTFALIQEDFHGISLKEYLMHSQFDLKIFLKVAVKVTEALGHIHSKNIVHKDIKPQNIIFNLNKEIIKITDFGIADELTHLNKEIFNSDIIEGTLPYMSPEQTGRMNRAVDYRTDIYSLGITFYEMLTKILPFTSNDPIEIVHCHIAKYPETPHEVNPTVPKILSDIVMKLISKNAEERYQNSFGLAYDLKECLKQLEETGEIKAFPLAQNDISIKFNIPQDIVGRESEIKELLTAFDRISNPNNSNIEVMLVCGQPGIGKSMLVNEIHKPIVAKRGYFITGKYDQFRRDVPYSSIIQAFQGLVNQLLVESDEKISDWKDKILNAVGSNGKIITDVIPAVKLIIGEQPNVPELGPEQSQNRFNLVFKNFVSVFTSKEHPLVLFLDDLQWADYASLALIKMILTDTDINHMFFIGAYRDTEVTDTHPLIITMDEIKKEGIKFNMIPVGPLKVNGVNRLIANFLHCKEEETRPLAELIHNKTNGNPFFVNQFLKNLYDEKIIELDPIKGWVWDILKIDRIQVTDNVVDMMIDKIVKLPDDTQELLKICSCIGNRFDLEMLSIIFEKGIEDTLKILTVAIEEGLVGLFGDMYRFYHDRIQEAAYSLIPNNKKAEMHYKIGNHILDNTEEYKLKDKILYIVDQLNSGRIFVNTEEERNRLTRLNLMAGIKSKSSSAYESSLKYLKIGIELLEEECWKKNYELTLQIYEKAVESSFLCAKYDDMEDLFQAVLLNAKSLLDKVKVYEIKMLALCALNKPYEALRAGNKILRQLGVNLPDEPKKIHILVKFIETKILLKRKKPEELFNIPEMKNEHDLAKIKILSTLGSIAYWSSTQMLVLIIFEAFKMSLKYGNSFIAPYVYVSYGFALCTIGDIEKGYRFGKMGLKLMENINIKEHMIRPLFVMNTFVLHWKESARNAVPSLFKTHQFALEVGEFEFAGYCLAISTNVSFHYGLELKELAKQLNKYLQMTQKINQSAAAYIIAMNYQSVLNLMGESDYSHLIKGDFYDEDIMLPLHIEANDLTNVSSVFSKKAMHYYFFGDYENAFIYCKKFLEIPDAQKGLFSRAAFFYYYSLTMSSLYDKVNDKKLKKQLYRKIKKNKSLIKKWSDHAPINYLHKYYLIEAEIQQINGNDDLTMDLYDKAIMLAKENQYLQDEAISYETAGKYYLKKGRIITAQAYMTGAYNAYIKWGAMAKIKDLEKKYPDLIIKQQNNINNSISETIVQSRTIASDLLDFSTVMKLLQMLSKEIDIKKLLESFIKIAVTNAGAQKGYLISKNEDDDNLYIEAAYTIDKDAEMLMHLSLDKCDNISDVIINYVYKTNQPVVLNNAQEEGIFTNDSYIVNNKVKSLLCLPVFYKNRISGIVYLENNLTTDVFTPERLELMNIISEQAAISIENAQLYRYAITDRMTGLYNSTYFHNTLSKYIEEINSEGKELSLLMLDIDHFKNINDTYGHLAGDSVLKNVADVIKMTCREEDFCARYGGEEFAIILLNTDVEKAKVIAEQIRMNIEQLETTYSEQVIKVTASLGITGTKSLKSDDINKEMIIQAADKALYESKNNGRNRVSA